MATFIVVLVIGVATALWFGLRRQPVPHTDDPGVLSFRLDDPAEEEGSERLPVYVDHTVDFRAMRYRRTSVFRNDGPWAESETSQADREFLVRRPDTGGWEARLVSRNSSTLDNPGEWGQVSDLLNDAWEEGWKRWSVSQKLPR